MQCFKLVNAGFVDKLIIFDALPERLVKGIKTRELAGLPRSWSKFLGEIGSTRPVYKTDTTQHPDRSYSFKYTPIGREPCFFVLEYTDINADKDAWRAISEYLRLNVGPEVRLKEKIEDMALPMAPDPKSPLSIETEDIPVIPVPVEVVKAPAPDEIIQPGETILVEEKAPKKRGRPRKVEVPA